MHTLLNKDGDHQYYLTGTDETGWQLLYYTHAGERQTWFNGRLNTPYNVDATHNPTTGTYTYKLPRRAPLYLFISPALIMDSGVKTLNIYTCPISAANTAPKSPYIATPGIFSFGDAKSPARAQFAELIDINHPDKIYIHLPTTNYNPDHDHGKYLTELATFCIEIRNWFYTQKRKTITPRNQKYTPTIYTVTDANGTTPIQTLTDYEIKEQFYCNSVNQFYERYSDKLPPRDTWQFNGKTYKTIDGEPELQNDTITEQVVKILLDVYKLRVNLVTDESEVWSRADDEFITLDEKMIRAIKIRLNEEFGIKISKDTLQEIIFSNWAELLHKKRYKRPTYHPYHDYFSSLQPFNPDTEPDYIKQIFQVLTIENINLSTRELSDETLTELAKCLPKNSFLDTYIISWKTASLHYFKKWFVGIVNQAIYKGADRVNQLMPILCGGQNKGKSTYIKYLLPPDLEPYYVVGGVVPSVSNYETAVNLRSNLLINFDDEPDGWTNREWKGLKTLITLPDVNYRAKYDKQPATHKRTCSFIATTNYPDILNDPTGTRRFIMLPILDIARNFWQHIDIDRVWAQAVFLANQKFRINLSKAELELLLLANSIFFEERTEEQILAELLSPITEEQAAEEIRNPDQYKAYDPAQNPAPTYPVLMREVDLIHLLSAKAQEKIQPKSLRNALQKLGYKSAHCYRQRTFREVRNQKCYAVTFNSLQPITSQEETPF
jgi:hypothetical protein